MALELTHSKIISFLLCLNFTHGNKYINLALKSKLKINNLAEKH